MQRQPPRPTPQGLSMEDCLEYMAKFVEKFDLTKIVWRHDIEYESRLHRDELKEKLRPQAKIAAGLPDRIQFVNREFMMDFAILSLYDLAVLIGKIPRPLEHFNLLRLLFFHPLVDSLNLSSPTP